MKVGQVRSEKRSRAALALVAMALLLLTVFSGLALADEDQGESPESASLVNPESMAGLEDLTDGQQVGAGPTTDPVAAEELPHTDLDRAGAEDLFVSVFPSILDEQTGDFDDLDVEAFRSDHVAVVAADSPGAPAGLLTSLLPLRAEDAEGEKSPVDLELGQQGDGLEPANPLVDVRIPGSLDEGISLPASNIGISLQGAPQRQASVLSGEAAFYPNVAQDADLAIVPTPTGVETTMQLRSAQAPTEQTFHLALPAGAALNATDDGGAVVIKNDERQLLIHPPSAIDANGDEVPVSMQTGADKITITVDPKPTSALPILVDPVFDNYYWSTWNNNTGMYTDWQPFSTNEATFKPTWIGVWNETMHTGLELRSYVGASVPGERASWFYYVPRYFSDFADVAIKAHPTSYIRYMTLSDVHFLIEEGAPVHQHPYFTVGIWSANKGDWVSAGPHTSSQGPLNGTTIEAPNPYEVSDANQAGIMLATSETSSYPRQLYVGQAFVEVTDKEPPGFASIGSSGWVNATAASQIPYKVSDSGLGIYSLTLVQPKASGGTSTVTTSANCVGTTSSPCPRSVESPSKPLLYEPGQMPQGEYWVDVTASDAIGSKSSVAKARIKVDHTAPELSLSGNLTEQGSVGTKLPEYTLNYNSADGDSATPAGMTPIGTSGSGAGQLQRPQGIALDSQGNIWVIDQQNNRVEKFGPSGNFISQFGTSGSANGQLSGPRGIAISPAGNIWVAEVGNKRVQEFNSSGGFIRAITGFSEPYGVATGPNETLWVTDSGIGGGVFRYKENGTKLGGVQTVPGAAPGVAVDAFGNAWVTDQITDKVYEYDTSGKLLFSFGTSGTADGQLNDPFGIAIAKSGNLLIADSSARVQEFKPDGTFMRKFGTTAGNSQLSSPRGLAVGPGNIAYIADEGTHRIARWSHADLDPQSGVAKVEVKVDGTLKATNAPGCSSKDCVLNGSWTLKADDYAVGTHKMETIATDGVGLQTIKSLNIETHGDTTAPTVALTGSITEQATLGTTLPAYKVKVAATDPGPAEERKSGVASIVIKVDGKTVDSTSPGCPAEGCSLNREWTLKSSSYSAGSHIMEATATDAAGKVKTASRTFEIKPDTIAPALTLSGAIAEAPEGWIQEGTKSLIANATDAGGYGVKQIRFQIDGKAVGESTVQTCELGSCTQSKTASINLTAFGGGAHEGVAFAEDLAGNVRKETWTINIDPLGQVTSAEAADTVEAAEDTAPENIEYAPVSGIVTNGVANEDSAPSLRSTSEGFVSEGSPVDIVIGTGPAEGYSFDTHGVSETELEYSGSITVSPVGSSEAPVGGVIQDSAVMFPNTHTGVDTVLHPAYDGIMAFTDIREGSAPESYTWDVTLEEDQSLKLIDEEHAAVHWDNGPEAILITAQPAHGADGETVRTTLSVSGHFVTETVHFHEQPVVYPVVAGVGWQGGFQTFNVQIEEEAPESGGEAEGADYSGSVVHEWTYSAPEHATLGEAEENPVLYSKAERANVEHRRFRYIGCHYIEDSVFDPTNPLRSATTDHCGNPFVNDSGPHGVAFSYAIRGSYFRLKGEWAKHAGSQTDHIECAKMLDKSHFGDAAIEWKYFITPVRCEWYGKTKEGEPKKAPYGEHITPYGEWNWGRSYHWDGPWDHFPAIGLALYIWASNTGYIGRHETTCIDCS